MLSTIGRGRGGTVKEAFNITTQHKMKSASEGGYEELRSGVFGFSSDVDNEKGVADIDGLEPVMGTGDNQFRIAHQRLYPNCLYMPEHLHMIYNALQNGVEKIPEHKRWIKQLRAIEHFLSDKSLRRLFMATCMKDDPRKDLFKYYSSVSIDWRWESLSKALDQLSPLFEILQEKWDLAKMMVSDDGKSDAALLREVGEVLKTPYYYEFSEAIRVAGELLEKAARRLEGCECHKDVWTSKASSKRKAKIMMRRSGHQK